MINSKLVLEFRKFQIYYINKITDFQVMDAIKILAEKCDHYIQELEDVDNE
jgi:hypothetical protein